jgi:large subunit ribosomal protein L24
MKLKKNDKVVIQIGKDSGKTGKIEKVFPKNNTVLLPGLNFYKRHMKKRDEKTPGGIIEVSRPISAGRVALICPKCEKPTRVGYKLQNKEKVRICRKCEANI